MVADIGHQHGLRAVEDVAGPDLASVPRLAEALAQVPVDADVEVPRELVEAVPDELIVRNSW